MKSRRTMLSQALQMYLDDASVDEFHADLESELERLESYHQQHADDAAKMSGKAPKTVLLNEEDWDQWNHNPEWTPQPDPDDDLISKYNPTTIPGKAEQKQYHYAAHITMSDIAKFHKGSNL